MLVHVIWHLSCIRCESLESFEKEEWQKEKERDTIAADMFAIHTFTYEDIPWTFIVFN